MIPSLRLCYVLNVETSKKSGPNIDLIEKKRLFQHSTQNIHFFPFLDQKLMFFRHFRKILKILAKIGVFKAILQFITLKWTMLRFYKKPHIVYIQANFQCFNIFIDSYNLSAIIFESDPIFIVSVHVNCQS